MPEILEDRRDWFGGMFGRVHDRNLAGLDDIAKRVANVTAEALRQRQPIGQEDELVLRDLSGRPARPSIRLDNEPIEDGWRGPHIVAENESERVISHNTVSPHAKFFTMMTGRNYLGVQTQGQTAANAWFLHFWWRGSEWKIDTVKPHGFTPRSDFVKDAWESVQDGAREALAGMGRVSLDEALHEQ